MLGTVKWFSVEKGFGFIKPDNGNLDIFVHVSEVQRAGEQSLVQGGVVMFEVGTSRSGKPQAVQLEIL